MGLSLLAIYMLGNKNKWGFVVYILSNSVWLFLGLTLMGSYGIVVGNIFFLSMNVRGYLNWKKKMKSDKDEIDLISHDL